MRSTTHRENPTEQSLLLEVAPRPDFRDWLPALSAGTLRFRSAAASILGCLALATTCFLLSPAALADVDSAQNLPAYDNEFGCMDAATAERLLSDFNVRVASFGGKELCNPRIDTKKLLLDLWILNQGRFKAPGQRLPLEGGFVPAHRYYDWTKAQTRSVRRANDIPYATAYNSGGNFTMQDGWAQLSTLGRVGTLVHEARHTAGYRHTPCFFGPYQGENLDACDSSFGAGGSHSVEMEYYARVALAGENFHPAYQQMARLMALGRSNWVFNADPLKPQESLVAWTIDQEILRWDARRSPETMGVLRAPAGSSEMGQIKRTSHGMSLLVSGVGWALDLTRGSTLLAGELLRLQEDFSYFKLLTAFQRRNLPKVTDAEEFDLGPLRYYWVINPSGKIQGYLFAQGKFGPEVQLVTPTGSPVAAQSFATSLPNGTRGGFVRAADNSVFRFDPNSASWASLNTQWNNQWVQVAARGDQTFALDQQGVVYQSSMTNGGFEVVPELSTARVQQLISVPVYSTFENSAGQ